MIYLGVLTPSKRERLARSRRRWRAILAQRRRKSHIGLKYRRSA